MATKTLTASLTPDSLRRLEADLAGIKNGVAKALAGAINKVVGKAETRAIKAVKDELTLSRDSIAEVIKGIKTSAKSNPMVGNLAISDKPRPMFDFPHRQLGGRTNKKTGTTSKLKGVSVKIRKGRPSKFPRAFIVKLKNGHEGIFGRAKGRSNTGLKDERAMGNLKYFRYSSLGSKLTAGRIMGRGKKKRVVGAGYAARLPIEELYGPSVTAVYANTPGLLQRELQFVYRTFDTEVLSQIDRLLKRRKADRPQ